MLEMLFGSKTRARVLARLLLDGRVYRLLELRRAVGTSVSSVQRELAFLESIGLVRSVREGDARFVSAVETHPLAGPLRAIFAAQRDVRSTPAVNPRVAPHVPEIIRACREHGAISAALVGSATQPDVSVVPGDLDVLVRFGPDPAGYADRYFGLLEELERIMGLPVEVIEEDGVVNPYLRAEFAATRVVLYEAA